MTICVVRVLVVRSANSGTLVNLVLRVKEVELPLEGLIMVRTGLCLMGGPQTKTHMKGV